MHLEKSHNNKSQPRLTSRGRLLEYFVDSRHLAAHRATTSSSRATFKFRLFLGLPFVCQKLYVCCCCHFSTNYMHRPVLIMYVVL